MDLTKGSYSEQEEEEEGRKEGGEKRAPNKAWPYKASLINWKNMEMYRDYMDIL